MGQSGSKIPPHNVKGRESSNNIGWIFTYDVGNNSQNKTVKRNNFWYSHKYIHESRFVIYHDVLFDRSVMIKEHGRIPGKIWFPRLIHDTLNDSFILLADNNNIAHYIVLKEFKFSIGAEISTIKKTKMEEAYLHVINTPSYVAIDA